MSRALVLGAGTSGLAASRLARRLGLVVTLYDQEPAPAALDNGFAVAVGEWDSGLLAGIDFVIASPGFSERSLPIVESLEKGVPVWSEIEFAWRNLQAPVIAVTGTNGKTSVTEATSAMLDASGINAPATGNIGSPLSDFTEAEYDALVVEVSSFQLRFIESFHPKSAAITNVAVDHLDWHGSEAGYMAAKARIFENQTRADLLVYDCDDRGATELALRAPTELYPISASSKPPNGGGVEGGFLTVGDAVIDIDDLVTPDPSHIANMACAAALSLHAGATASGVAGAAAGYLPGAHRRSLVAQIRGVTWVDDSKATNPHAAIASIRAHHDVILIAGGRAKGLDVRSVAEEADVKMLIGIGEIGPALVEAAGRRGRLAGTLEVAVEMASQAAEEGDTVLLAPGCASFDQFQSYEERGERFAELVEEKVRR